MVKAGKLIPDELLTVNPVRVFWKYPKPVTEPPPKLSTISWLLPTLPLNVNTPLLVVIVRLLSTSTVF